jgi:putative membrane protein
MDFLFTSGFLGTRAPLFMDIVSVIVAVLPFLIYGAISLAKKKNYGAHESVQKLLFIVTVIVVAFFEFGVRMEGGYKNLMEGSSVGHNYFIYVLIFHIIISVITLILWSMTRCLGLRVTLCILTMKKIASYLLQTFMNKVHILRCHCDLFSRGLTQLVKL